MEKRGKIMKVCYKCGFTAENDEVICPNCGAPLDNIEEENMGDFDLAYEDDTENGEI